MSETNRHTLKLNGFYGSNYILLGKVKEGDVAYNKTFNEYYIRIKGAWYCFPHGRHQDNETEKSFIDTLEKLRAIYGAASSRHTPELNLTITYNLVTLGSGNSSSNIISYWYEEPIKQPIDIKALAKCKENQEFGLF